MHNDDTGDHDEDKTVLVQEKLIRTKGKSKAHLRPNDIYVDLKQKTRRGKCLGAGHLEYSFPTLPPLMEQVKGEEKPNAYNTIGSEIWYYIAEHIPPEAVRTFALICRQTADLVNTRKFWNHLYRRYCKRSLMENNKSLPQDLQVDNIRCCDKIALRAHVIESLFYAYDPLVERAKRGYSLENLIGHTYLASWHEQQHCVWIMCYKFCDKIAMKRKRQLEEAQLPTGETDDDWESLASNKLWRRQSTSYAAMYPHEGVTLLVICCDRFLPFPNQLLYECAESRAKLSATRQMLALDMRGSNLELDFVDAASKNITTVKYPKIMSCKALPWWHPDFRKFIK